ncbi:MAG: uroporphyrinogen-III synthase [Cytophagales bacterium]|nr:uroporphyrinogen-III synthase [Cytophagales bacterium]
MEGQTHLVSTKILAPELVEQVKKAGLSISLHNFIQSIIRIPAQLAMNQLHKHIVLTSKSAVKSWLAIAQQHSVPLTDHLIFCTDQGTRQEALANDLTIVGTARDASTLADVIESNGQIKAVTFVCSNVRRDDLPSKLTAKGISVIELIGYDTEPTPTKINEPYHGVLFFSPSGVDSFLSSNQIAPVCFCIGTTTAVHAAQKGFSEIQIAELATTESMIKKVVCYYTKDAVYD